MSYTIALNFKDGVTRFIDCEQGETVAAAAYRQGVNIPLGCCEGECGTCKSRCEAGRFSHGPYFIEALTPAEAGMGCCLPCQMYPKTDCVLSIATTSDNCGAGPSEFRAEIIKSELISASTIALSLKIREEDRVPFLPGQYLDLQVPGTETSRSYSYSSNPHDAVARFLIRNVPTGLMARYLVNTARPGDQILCNGPFGGFYLRQIERPILMLAGGTGLAPFLSMLDQLIATGHHYPVHLVYGVTSDADLVEVETLMSIAGKMPNFSFTTCVADRESSHSQRGFVTDFIHPDSLHGGRLDVYLCGPPAMVDAARTFFREKALTPDGFYYEKFAPNTDQKSPRANVASAKRQL